MDVVVAPADGRVALRQLGADGADGPPELHGWDELAGRVRELEQPRPRWVWADTTAVYPRLLGEGVLVRRACDLRLGHAVLSRSRYLRAPLASVGDERWRPAEHDSAVGEPTLLDLPPGGPGLDLDEVVAEPRRQQRAVAESTQPERLRLLLAAESAGGLVAAELGHVGLPFDADVHDAQLTALLGPKPL